MIPWRRTGRNAGCKRLIGAQLAFAVILPGCATTAVGPREVSYSCGDDPDLTVVFQRDGALINRAEGPAIKLQRRPADTGFWYESPTHSIRGEGQSLTYTVGRMVPVQCQEVVS